MARSDAQPLRDFTSTDPAYDARVADDDEDVGGARHPDVQPLPRAIAVAGLVDAQHDGRPLEALAAEDVAVEDVLALPEAPPVPDLAVPLGLRLLLGVAVTGGEQRDVSGIPPLVEQPLRGSCGSS